jgi:hypothetical protein
VVFNARLWHINAVGGIATHHHDVPVRGRLGLREARRKTQINERPVANKDPDFTAAIVKKQR